MNQATETLAEFVTNEHEMLWAGLGLFQVVQPILVSTRNTGCGLEGIWVVDSQPEQWTVSRVELHSLTCDGAPEALRRDPASDTPTRGAAAPSARAVMRPDALFRVPRDARPRSGPRRSGLGSRELASRRPVPPPNRPPRATKALVGAEVAENLFGASGGGSIMHVKSLGGVAEQGHPGNAG